MLITFLILLYCILLIRSLRLYNKVNNDKYKCVFNISKISEVSSCDFHLLLVIYRIHHKLSSVVRCFMMNQCHLSSGGYRFHLMGTY